MNATATLDDARATFRARLTEPHPRRFAKRDDSRHPLDVLEAFGLFTVYDFAEVCNLGPAQSIRMIHQLHREKLIDATPFVGQYRVAPRQGCALPPVNTCTALVLWHSAPPQFAANYLRRFVVEQYPPAEFAPRPMQLEPVPF